MGETVYDRVLTNERSERSKYVHTYDSRTLYRFPYRRLFLVLPFVHYVTLFTSIPMTVIIVQCKPVSTNDVVTVLYSNLRPYSSQSTYEKNTIFRIIYFRYVFLDVSKGIENVIFNSRKRIMDS